MAKSSSKGGSGSKATFDKIAKAAMSREMLAAGLTAAAAAIAASPKARKAIRDAGLDAADSAAGGNADDDQCSSSALIAEAYDAANVLMSGKWATRSDRGTARRSPSPESCATQDGRCQAPAQGSFCRQSQAARS
jgi:hypothetical protein